MKVHTIRYQEHRSSTGIRLQGHEPEGSEPSVYTSTSTSRRIEGLLDVIRAGPCGAQKKRKEKSPVGRMGGGWTCQLNA